VNSQVLVKQPTASSVFSFSRITSAAVRERVIDGCLLGGAVGDALGQSSNGLSRRNQFRMFGSDTLGFRLVPGVGIVGADTHLMFMVAQSICRSKATRETFVSQLRSRLGWYVFGLALPSSPAIRQAGLRAFVHRGGPAETGSDTLDDNVVLRSLLLSAVLQGTGVSIKQWVAASCLITNDNQDALDACDVVLAAGQLTSYFNSRDFDSLQAIDLLIEGSLSDFWTTRLGELREDLSRNLSVRSVAVRLGWSDGLPNCSVATVTMGLYSFLRNPHRYRFAVERVIRLGGETDGPAAFAGGLAAMLNGSNQIPPEYARRMLTWPNDTAWVEGMSRRLHAWPHGVNDIQSAPGEAIRPVSQFVRNGLYFAARVAHRLVRLPWVMTGFARVEQVDGRLD
jgi:ADP-ribosylglycohydrolase